MNADLRISLVSLVHPQIDATLDQAAQAFTRHAAQTADNAALAACPLQLHQVYGALRMAQLDGAARYCTELEAALRNAMRAPVADKAEIDCIQRGVGVLRKFVGDVGAGGEYVPMRLYPAYRELARVSGNESAGEKDLFVPETPDPAHPPPAHAEPRTITTAVLPALLKELRSRYQRGLLGWLKQTASPEGLVQMREVLDTLHRIAGQLPESRGLWWAAGALIDCAIDTLQAAPDTRQSDWLARVKPVCSRIDFVLRDLAALTTADTGTALRDVLYTIAIADSPLPCMREVRACFQLDGMLSAARPVDDGAAAALKPAIADVRARLDNLKDAWSDYAAGESNRLERFRAMRALLAEKSQALRNAPLSRLLDAIGAAATNLPDPYPPDAQILSLEMASSLLMAEGIAANFDDLPADLEQQVVIMCRWLNEAAQGKAATICPPGLRTDIVQKVNDEKVRAITAREILKDLAQIEKTIETFTRDRSLQPTLTPLAGDLRKISGVFQISNQKRASRLATLCQRLLERCAHPAHAAVDQDIAWLAEGLGSLGFYLEPCLQGKLPAERAVNLFFTRYEKQAGGDAALAMTQPLPAAAPVDGKPAASVPAGVDHEMLDVFLEEANDVLGAIEAACADLHKAPDDHDALLGARRAFHTLKGSARMVGLAAFGECAWEMEQLLNHWRAQSHAATPELLALMNDARELLAEWAHALRGGEQPAVDPAGVAARARALRGAPTEAQPLPPALPVTPAGDTAGMPASVESEAPSSPRDDMTAMMPDAAEPEPDFMSVVMPAVAAASSEETTPAALCDQALSDLGDRLEWLNGLIEEIGTQTSTNIAANSRLREIAHMMAESMAEAATLHQALREHIETLKNPR